MYRIVWFVLVAVFTANTAHAQEVVDWVRGWDKPAIQATVPSAPTGVSANAGDTTVSLSWNASVGATSYNVKRATANGGPYTMVGTVSGTNYNDTNLTNGTTYYYVVTATNQAGESAPSNQVSATPSAPTPPVTPSSNYGLWGLVGLLGLLGLLCCLLRRGEREPERPRVTPEPEPRPTPGTEPEAPAAGATTATPAPATPGTTGPAPAPTPTPAPAAPEATPGAPAAAPGTTGPAAPAATAPAATPAATAAAPAAQPATPATPAAPPQEGRREGRGRRGERREEGARDQNELDLATVLGGTPTGTPRRPPATRPARHPVVRRVAKAARRTRVIIIAAVLTGLGFATTATAQTVRINPNFAMINADPNVPAAPVTVNATITGVANPTAIDVPAGWITGTIAGNKATIIVTPQAREGANNLYVVSASGQRSLVKFYVFGHLAGSVADFTRNNTTNYVMGRVRATATELRTELDKARAEAKGGDTAVRNEIDAMVQQRVQELNTRISEGESKTADAIAASEQRTNQRVDSIREEIRRLLGHMNILCADLNTLAAKRVQLPTGWPRRFIGADRIGRLAKEDEIRCMITEP